MQLFLALGCCWFNFALVMINSNKKIGVWLMVGVVMIVVQVVIGGITRLTGSGLSITEWKPIMGALPPLNDADWLIAFEKYKEITQFKLINSGFGVQEFKTIFFWEWFHRLWARLFALVFIVPFVYWSFKKEFSVRQWFSYFALFLLGGVQGAVGWVMVQSGLAQGMVSVAPLKLGLHFIVALATLGITFYFALRALYAYSTASKPKLALGWVSRYLVFMLVVLLLQLFYGALMAGSKAGLVAPTWPGINGCLLPASVFSESPLWHNFLDNALTIHWVHRSLAALLVALVIGFYYILFVVKIEFGVWFGGALKWLPAINILLQALLGVLTVRFSVVKIPLALGVLHQVVGMGLLLTFIALYFDYKNGARPKL
jgi:cytochrome c oxidase assembly protein subunit 15